MREEDNTSAKYYVDTLPGSSDRDFVAFSGVRCEGVLGSSHSPGPTVHGLRTAPEPYRLILVRLPYLRAMYEMWTTARYRTLEARKRGCEPDGEIGGDGDG